MLDSYNRFALIMAALVGAMCLVLGVVAKNLFLLLVAGGIFYTVIVAVGSAAGYGSCGTAVPAVQYWYWYWYWQQQYRYYSQ